MKLLHINSSINGQNSVTRLLSQHIVNHIQSHHTQGEYLDLDKNPIPHLHSAPNAQEVAQNEKILDQFMSSDTIVLGVPMYNFTIPTTLKAWIDRICVAGKTFKYTSEGPQGLMKGKTIIIASSRGSTYANPSPKDFQERYLIELFNFLGIDDIHIIQAQGVAQVGQRQGVIDQALKNIKKLRLNSSIKAVA